MTHKQQSNDQMWRIIKKIDKKKTLKYLKQLLLFLIRMCRMDGTRLCIVFTFYTYHSMLCLLFHLDSYARLCTIQIWNYFHFVLFYLFCYFFFTSNSNSCIYCDQFTLNIHYTFLFNIRADRLWICTSIYNNNNRKYYFSAHIYCFFLFQNATKQNR